MWSKNFRRVRGGISALISCYEDAEKLTNVKAFLYSLSERFSGIIIIPAILLTVSTASYNICRQKAPSVENIWRNNSGPLQLSEAVEILSCCSNPQIHTPLTKQHQCQNNKYQKCDKSKKEDEKPHIKVSEG